MEAPSISNIYIPHEQESICDLYQALATTFQLYKENVRPLLNFHKFHLNKI